MKQTRTKITKLSTAGLVVRLWQFCFAIALLALAIWPFTTYAGGPIAVGGGAAQGTGPEGDPFIMSSATINYQVDGGSFGTLSQSEIRARIAQALQRWTDVPTSAVTFVDSGGLDPAVVPDGDVDTVSEFTNLLGPPGVLVDCGNAIILDADGSLFQALGITGTTAFSFGATCNFDSTTGKKTSAAVILNGGQFDGNQANGELPQAILDELIMHEVGHLLGLNHSQINQNCYTSTNCAVGSDDTFGYPTMTTGRILASGVLVEEATGVPAQNSLAPDDMAWVSLFYPETVNNPPAQIPFTSAYGIIEGQVLYSDGLTGAQRVNVIARLVDDPSTPEDESRRNAVSSISGQLFTSAPGNAIINASSNPFGSRDPALKGFFQIPVPPGTYRVEVESYSQTPPAKIFSTAIPNLTVQAEFFGGPESNTDDPAAFSDVVVVAGVTVPGIDILLNGTPPRFDSFDTTARNEDHTTASLILSGQHRASISPFDANGGDQDTYAFDAVAGTPVTIEIFSSRTPLATSLNSVIEILDITGARLATCRDPIESAGDTDFNGVPDSTPNAFDDICANNDINPGSNTDSMLEFDPPGDGTYFVRVSDARGDARPDFEYDLLLSGAFAPAPALDLLSTTNVPAGSGDLSLSVTGTEFVPNSVIRWNGADRATTFVSGTELQVVIPAADIATGAADVPVTVFNPTPGGGESGALLIDVADFNMTATPASASVAAGQSATYTVTINPQFGSYDNAIALTCSGVPALASCSLSPNSSTPGTAQTTATLTITTTASGASFPQMPGGPNPPALYWLAAVLALLGFALMRHREAIGYRAFKIRTALAAITLFSVLLFASCGGGSNSPPRPGTPPGTSTITVTGTAGSLTQTATVSLVVQ